MGLKMKADRTQQGGETDGPRVPPGWELVDEGRAIRRCYELPSFRAAVAFVVWVGALAGPAECRLVIGVRWTRVTITIGGVEGDEALTDEDVALASRIDGREPEGEVEVAE